MDSSKSNIIKNKRTIDLATTKKSSDKKRSGSRINDKDEADPK